MRELPPIPDLMKDLPLFHGLPIPYATFVGEDGIPDFKVTNAKLRIKCMMRELCALCGKPLTKGLVVLIGGPKCVKDRIFFDPPMHQECALYATKACPFLADYTWDYATQDPRHLGKGDSVIRTYEEIDSHRPDKLAVYYCRSYEMVRNKGTWWIKAGRPFKIDWDACARRVTTTGDTND